jgi:hypothetical protein
MILHRLCGLVVRDPGFGLDSHLLPQFLRNNVSITEELFERKAAVPVRKA